MVTHEVGKAAVMPKPLPGTGTPCDKRQKRPSQPLQAPRRSHSEQPTHHDSQIVRGHLHQIALRYLCHPVQPTTPATARLAHMRETPLYSFTPQPLQSF